MEICLLTGPDIRLYWRDLAALRIAVFREYPYLYEGSMEYEEHYLQPYLNSPRSLVVLVRDQGAAVGASTALPLKDEGSELQDPWRQAGMPVDKTFYLGESVLLPDYRSRGLGHRFFEEREAHARRQGGFEWACFAAVERPSDHPGCPPDYRPLDEFWQARGYRLVPDVVAYFSWKDRIELSPSPKPMKFWRKRL